MSIQNQSEIKKDPVDIVPEDLENKDLLDTFEKKKLAVKRKLFESSNAVKTRNKEADIDFTAIKTQDEEQFIFSIFKKKIKYDGEDAYIVYFKDVTFGVLYEQIKAQKSFQEIINATISHEMRNPLNSIISNCSLLEGDSNLNEKQRKRLKTMRISCNLLTSFLHDLIDWTQIKLGKFNKKVEYFNIRSTFNDIIKMMKFKADMKNIFCKVEFQDDFPKFVYGDNQRLMQLTINLISNALKFTFEGGVITRVKYYYDTNKVYVEVTDTGEGIKQENKDKLFKLFTTFENKVEKNINGIGLGLCICKAVVEQFNGKIDFVSDPGIGTTFMFTFQLDGVEDHGESANLDIQETDRSPSLDNDNNFKAQKRKI